MSEPQKITPEYAQGKRLVFYPETAAEAIVIQKKLFDMGFTWRSGEQKVANVEECVRTGMLLEQGKIYYSPKENSQNVRCSVHQLDADYMPPLERRMQEMFNTLMARMDALQAQMGRLERKLSPEPLDKPARLPRAGAARGNRP